ncbi:MAG: fumarylacetoacetate hydrolase family protein [Lautropia sp.]|nr:fumarylacetoacetate hydrolase family protein [Lautropia sp.]
MKLATRKDGTRDGQLTVVSRDLKHAVLAEQIVGTLQRALDDWDFMAPQLQELYEQLNLGRAPRSFDFDPLEYMAPLPRPFERIEALAYPAGMDRLRKAGLTAAPSQEAVSESGMPSGAGVALAGGHNEPQAESPPLTLAPTSRSMPGNAPVSVSGLALHLGLDAPDEDTSRTTQAVLGADGDVDRASNRSPTAATVAPDQGTSGLDFGAQLLVICDDTPMDIDAEEAGQHILLLGMANGWRTFPPGSAPWRADRGLAWAPVVSTPDELGEDWREGRIHRPVHCRLNGRSTGRLQAAEGMKWDFRQLLATLSRLGPIHAGCVVCSGPIANASLDSGFASIIDARARHLLEHQSGPGPAFLQAGDRLRIDMADQRGHSLFGTIDQQIVS